MFIKDNFRVMSSNLKIFFSCAYGGKTDIIILIEDKSYTIWYRIERTKNEKNKIN
jgi:hypothetical protein